MKRTPKKFLCKHWNDMNRGERRAYKRWLAKNNMWDGAEVLERLSNNKHLSIRN